ncbi:MAG: hypothetical protein ACXW4K_02330 [Candidatus Deferrimicrobiaceae bacterium]
MVLFSAWLFPGATRTESDLPLFDAHVYYNREAWEVLPPEAGITILDRAGVARALVSSTPDDGTLRKGPWAAGTRRCSSRRNPCGEIRTRIRSHSAGMFKVKPSLR